MFSGKKFQWKYRKLSFNDVLHPIILLDEVNSNTISPKFYPFSLPIKILQTFSNAFQAVASAEFNSVLKTWSSNSCVTCGPTNIYFFLLGHIYFGEFLPDRQIFRFLCPSLSQIRLSNQV